MEEKFEIKFWECGKCGHRWTNRTPEKPVICPNCGLYLYIREVETKEPTTKDC
jgi:rubrerythrin